MTKRRRILHADKIIQNVVHLFCLLMFLQLKGYYSLPSNPILLYSTASDIRIVNTSRLNKVNTILKDLESGSAVDFLFRKNLICWSDQIAELIQCTNYNDSHVGDVNKIVSEGLITPAGIAIDWYTDKIYWTDGETNRIEVISIDHKYRKVLFWSEVDLARAIAVVPKEGLLFWTDWGEVPKIERAGMNGDPTTRKVIVKENIFWPNGITIDYDNSMVYWVDAQLHFIDAIDFNGENRRRVVKTGLVYPYAITVVSEKLYWTDWKTWAIHFWDMSTNGPKVKELIQSKPVPVDIKVYDESRQLMPEGDYPCKTDNGGCSHLCLLAPTEPGYSCACPTGVKLKDGSNTTCFNNPQSMLIIAQRATISKISLDSPDFTPYALPLKDLKRAQTVDFDPKSEYIYWTDNAAKTISRARLDGSEQSVIVQSSGVPDSIAIDPLARNIYWTDSVTDTINVARLDGSSSKVCTITRVTKTISRARLDGSEQSVIVQSSGVPDSIAIDPLARNIYWTDSVTDTINVARLDGSSSKVCTITRVTKTISRARLDGSEQSVIVQSSGVPDSIAIDPLARNIYWTDSVTDTINVARLDGSSSKIIIHSELYEPRAIALHPVAGWMFWSDWNEKKPKIERANLDGSGRTLLVAERLAWPNGIALDLVQNKLYWGDARTRKIEVCNMDGSHRKELHSTEILHIFGLTLLGDYLYWTDMQKRTLDRINKDTGEERQLVVEQMPNMMGVKAFHIGEPLGANRCSDNNGGCSHLCFNRPQDYVCGCPLGLELGNDHKTCIEPEAFLLYSRKNIIGRISIENEGNDAILPVRDLKEVSAIAVHMTGNKIYWSDTKTKTINRCSINGSNMEKILEWTGLVEGLAIDWSGQNMYFTDTATQRIEVARLDGSSRRSLLWQGLKKPKSIVVDPKRGYMYWSELGSRSIKRAALDGSTPTVLLESVGRVHALAIDSKSIYWAALDPPGLGAAKLDGTGRKILVTNVTMPYALALYGENIYWGDWNTGIVESANKSDFTNRHVIHSGLDYISVLAAAGRGLGGGGGACGAGNGGCSHLCISLARGTRCACPAHYTLHQNTCTEPEEYLLFAQKNAVGRVVIANGEVMDAYIPLSGLKNVKTIDYDPIDKQLYWMEDDVTSIRRAPLSSSPTSAVTDATPVISGLSRPAYMVLDVLGRTLYWTCSDTDSINATSLVNASEVGVVVRGENMQPRHLAFHQTKRILVWNDVGLGVIMRSNVDGTSRVELARAHNATALTIEQASATVYWAVGRQIHAVDIDGNNKRVQWQGGWVGSLAAVGGWLYLSGNERTLMRLPLHRRDAPAASVPHLTRQAAAHAVHPVPRSHPCYGGGGCGCAACGPNGVCGCGLKCGRTAPPCRPQHFHCDTHAEQKCIPLHWKCDGQHDCSDGSDEAWCGRCAGGLRCADGSCGAALSSCGTGAFCDSADLPHAFRCDEDRLCLPPALVCDGHQHCADGADETRAGCSYTADTEPEAGSSRAGESHVLAVCGGCALAAGAAGAAWAAARRYRRTRAVPPPPPALPLVQKLHHAHTDSSTTTESSGRYPRPTVNPPPSPATASSGAGGVAAAGGRRRAYRHYRAINRPPPPTPASTDACESEPEARAPPPSPAPASVIYRH